jgi:phosphoenolpyruvate-protein kinase (PTS system EI component)
MSDRELRGVPASPGTAVGVARLLAAPEANGARIEPACRPAEIERAHVALEAAAAQLETLAARLAADGGAAEAEIVDTGALMARDPGLAAAVEAAIAGDGLTAPAAILTACAAQADILAALTDETLAARADDVRSLGRRAARLAAPGSEPVPGRDEILVADDLGPADVAELGAGVQAIALAGGGATAHAAIVARSLGVPMVAALGADVLAVGDGELLVVDGAAGVVVANPSRDRVAAARAVVRRSERAREQARAQRDLPARTTDGHRVVVLANVAGAAELELALDAGAEGVGLLRTELGFLDARAWPSRADHVALLAPILAGLGGRPATVRTLDFGGDKLPPFLVGEQRRGIGLLLGEIEALGIQLRAIVEAAGAAGADVRVLFPMVSSVDELAAAADALAVAASAAAAAPPPLGPMIETPEAAAVAELLAARSDFLSIGTNDLAASVLGDDRFAPGTSRAHDPRVLAAIARTVRAGARAGIPVEVCGEAASDPVALPLLVGLGVDELSVGASRVGTVRGWVRELEHAQVAQLATDALAAASAEEVERLVAPVAARLVSAERGDAVAQRIERERSVVSAGGQR